MNHYEHIIQKINNISVSLQPFASEDALFNIAQIGKNFTRKVEDFNREGRKLNIGVIGRVKAGKSSFLNTLLFDGKEVLPKAATPKTAALTKMEYSDENRVVIEFYTPEEWESITEDARMENKNDVTKSAKELVDMAKNRQLDIEGILQQGSLDKAFDEYSELLSYLNSFVGENGKYTPLVRSVVIYMNREEFRDISIVDTPGLNDPIPSRTQRTKEFIEVCDVVFFLSRAGSFLDKEDWELLCKQLPQKGVKKMVLIASQCDSGLRDVLIKEEKKSIFTKPQPWRTAASTNKATNLPDAKKIVEDSMKKRIREKIQEFSVKRDMGEHETILEILKECETPILISSRAQDMAKKTYEQYTPEEKSDYEYWKDFIPAGDVQKEFTEIGNFSKVKMLYEEIKAEKKQIMEEKQREFVPKVLAELKYYLQEYKKQTEIRIQYLNSHECEELEEQKLFFEGRIYAIRADISEVFGDTLEKIKLQKADVNKTLRQMSLEAAKLETHTGTETHHGTHTSYRYSFGPFRWGKHSESYSYETTYTYLAASDALEQITAYGKNAASEIEDIFLKIVELKAYRRKLLDTVIRNFDAGEKGFDANYFRIVVQDALNSIDFPEVHIDVSNELAAIGNQFSGEVRNSSDQDKFRNLLSSTVEKLYGTIIVKVDSTIAEFQESMKQIQRTLSEQILEKVCKEFDEIQAAFQEKEQEIEKNGAYIELLNQSIQSL